MVVTRSSTKDIAVFKLKKVFVCVAVYKKVWSMQYTGVAYH